MMMYNCQKWGGFMEWNEIRKNHYENFLSKHYLKVFGGYEKNIERNLEFFRGNSIISAGNSTAFDLGCGCGFQSIPLSVCGFSVFAVDADEMLLKNLAGFVEENGIRNVHVIKSDIFTFIESTELSPDLIVCMGDTLSHLESVEHVKKFLGRCTDKLLPNGILSLSFRDYSKDITDENRFVFTGGDRDSFFECFIEKDGDKLKTYDISHIWNCEKQNWETEISKYFKCVLFPGMIDDFLQERRMENIHSIEDRGMIFKIFQKRM